VRCACTRATTAAAPRRPPPATACAACASAWRPTAANSRSRRRKGRASRCASACRWIPRSTPSRRWRRRHRRRKMSQHRRRHEAPAVHHAPGGTMIRVCLVDDQTLVRQGIRSLLALDGGIEVIAEASDGKQAVELIPQAAPDVVLMDMRMPVMSGLEALQVLSRQGQLPPTIILTTFDDDQLVLAGLKAGAKGYLLKDVSLEQLVGAIRAVAEGGSLVQPAMTQRLLSGLEHMRNEFVSLDRPDPLTDRETEILRLMAGGFSNKEIANSLGVAEGTIK